MSAPDTHPVFRLAYVPGVTPAKWVRTWGERRRDVPLELLSCSAADGVELLTSGGAHAALLRLPVGGADELDSIVLYRETAVAVVPTDHLLTAADEVTVADLADEPVLHPLDDPLEWGTRPGLPVEHRPETTAEAVELVAAGVGTVVVPQSLARLYHRRDLTYRPVTDGPVSPVGLVWPAGAPDELVEEFIGIVRGRTANSSRGQSDPPPKRTAREKALAKQAARAAAGKSPARRRGPDARRGRR
ncbi:LysR substrate-binding domain-containing protein [Tsukamurella soli]|uniref:LysR substrate-binding domain-containing protein n=1 Tax=Tsukamurella soli TaxID=644556 RepID=A0ABP8KE68_9ACTN